jgi:hypothetical protein
MERADNKGRLAALALSLRSGENLDTRSSASLSLR